MSPEALTAFLEELLSGEEPSAALGDQLASLTVEMLTPQSAAAGVRFLLSRCIRVEGCAEATDIVGTGGGAFRQKAAINVSTMASITAASLGTPVCKQGNRKASSTSGSADLFEALGCRIDLGPEEVRRSVAEAGLGYCFAPRFHPGLAVVRPLRLRIGRATLFNWLAPLANPAQPNYRVLGTYDMVLGELLAGTLLELGVERATIVVGRDGLDELGISQPSTVMYLDGTAGTITKTEFDPATELGVSYPAEPVGGDTATNLAMAQALIGGGGAPDYVDMVAANTALALYASGAEESIRGGWVRARATLADGIADWFKGLCETMAGLPVT